MFTKEEAKQANDELDLQLEQDKGIHQRFAAVLQEFEQNPDLSFMRPYLADQSHLLENSDGVNKVVKFRALSPLQEDMLDELSPNTLLEDEDEEEEEVVGTTLRQDVVFELRRSIENLLALTQRQRELQDKLQIANNQSDYEGTINPKVIEFTNQLNDMIIPIQTIAVTINGLRSSLKAINESGLERSLVAGSNHNNNAVTEGGPSYKRK